MLTLEDLIFDVMEEANGALEPTVERAVRRGATEFLRDSTAWRTVQDEYAVSSVNAYPVYLPSGARLSAVLAVKHNGNLLRNVTPQAFSPTSNTGRPLTYRVLNGEVEVDGALVYGDILSIFPVLLPSADWDELPDPADEWVEGIRAAALHRLLSMPGQPWSDPGAAVRQYNTYRHFVDLAKQAATGEIHQPARKVKFKW